MNIRIIAVGKMREKYLSEAAEEYIKRIGRFAKTQVIQIADRKTDENASEAQIEQALKKEGDDILAKLMPSQYVIALCVEGQKLNSVEFSKKISAAAMMGKSDIAFVIGGSFGLDEAVKKRADLRLSFSDMTFPHRLMRVILLEQIYRAFKIAANETYHK